MDKQDTVAATFRSSGKTQQEFCTEHGITLAKLRYHLYKKHKRAGTPTPVPSRAFISFTGRSDKNPESRHPVIIIRGEFTLQELGRLISGTD